MTADQKQLRPTRSSKVIFKLLNQAKQRESNVILWKMVTGVKVITEIQFRTIRKFNNEIEFIPAAGTEQMVKQIVGGEEVVNFYLPHESCLFRCKVKSFSDDGILVVSFPKLLAQVDRRADIRLYASDNVPARIKFQKSFYGQRIQNQAFDKQIYDISAGGISFITSKMENKYFEVGDEIHNMHLCLDNHNLYLSGKILSIVEIEPDEDNGLIYKGQKICIQFENASLECKKKIGMFVFKFLNTPKLAI